MICECGHAAFLHKYGVCTAWPCDCTEFREARNDKAESAQGIHSDHDAEPETGMGDAVPVAPPDTAADTGGPSDHVSLFVDLRPGCYAGPLPTVRAQVRASVLSPLQDGATVMADTGWQEEPLNSSADMTDVVSPEHECIEVEGPPPLPETSVKLRTDMEWPQ